MLDIKHQNSYYMSVAGDNPRGKLPKNKGYTQLMNHEENVLKIRFRLPNGEEFEAQGPREFIERERNHFLALIGQTKPAVLPVMAGPATPVNAPHTELYLWEKLLKEDGDTLILRRKTKLSAPEVALLLLAGARVLLKKPAYLALELAHSLKACGIEGGRLDRLLAGEIQAGRMAGEGTKRSRTYRLTDEGFAKAFVLAENLLKQL